LMNGFYKALVGGQRAAQAIRSASDLTRSGVLTSHPYYWAGFMVFGPNWN
jgi:CHAT domain-containing protein